MSGVVVASEKHYKLEGRKLLLVQPLALDGTDKGVALLAVDGVKDVDGRIKFYDVEKKQPRLVDPRTINWAIIANVKYVVKS